jgi:hypothetical protein
VTVSGNVWEQPAAGRRRWPTLLGVGIAVAVAVGLAGPPDPGPRLDVVEADDPLPEPPPRATPPAAVDGPGRWQEIAPAPIVRRTGHSAVWTGDEVLVWGGVRTDPRPHSPEIRVLGDGAAYRARRDTWRRLPRAPIAPRHGHTAVWTGREMIVWGGSPGGPGAAFDPRTSTWRVLPAGPLDDVGDANAAWDRGALSVWTADSAAAYLPTEDRWELLSSPPEPAAEAHDGVLAVGAGRLVRWEGEGGAVLMPRASGWQPLASGPLAPRDGAVVVWASDRLVIWGGADPPRHFADGATLHLPPYGHGSRVSVGR